MGQDAHPHPAPAQAPHDVRLQPVVDDRHERCRLARADLRDRRRRHLGDEVLVLPARDCHGAGGRRRSIEGAGLEDRAAQAAVGAKVPGEGARVHAGDRKTRV